MAIVTYTLCPDYWEHFQVEDEDIEYIYNHLLELETPLTTEELTQAVVIERIQKEKTALQNRKNDQGLIYLPKDHYSVGQSLVFSSMEWLQGTVVSIRPGHNPEYAPFDVIEVKMEKGDKHLFAAGLEKHKLNQPIEVNLTDPLLNPTVVMEKFGEELSARLMTAILDNPDLNRVAGMWFPRALLVDVNVGHLNLAEAVLDMNGGGPLTTHALVEQIDLHTDVNPQLTEFSLNYFMEKDGRFDEVGPSGEVLWFLQRLEPEAVRQPPVYLRYNPVEYDRSSLSAAMLALEKQLDDELEDHQDDLSHQNDAVISLTFPHWRAGTLPLSRHVMKMFPTALEAPRVQFTLVDGENGNRFSGWVVRPNHYVYGLRDWYRSQGLIPGSLVRIRRGKVQGEVEVSVEKRRSNREWIRTILVGSDGGIVYAMLKQVVTAAFDERMAIFMPETTNLDRIWDQPSRQRMPLVNVVADVMGELAKLNPQGHVHAQELYAAVNMVRRCPPGPIFTLLVLEPRFRHVGDLYYRLTETTKEE